MKIKDQIKGLAGVALIFAAIGVVSFLTLNRLKSGVNDIVRDTLPSLSYAGEFNASLGAGFTKTLLLISAENESERLRYETEMVENGQKNSGYLAKYQESIFDSEEDRRNYNRVLRIRADSMAIRDEITGLVHAQKQAAALAEFKERLVPAFDAYKRAARVMLDFNIREGQERGEQIMRTCTITEIFVAVIGVVFFIIGFWLAVLSPTKEERRLMGEEVEIGF
jgi:hypothetical protein